MGQVDRRGDGAVMVAIKLPAAYDTSHWKVVPDFAKVEPRPRLVFTKATEAYPGTPFRNITDPTFEPYFKDLQQDGILRGAFHFHRKAYNPILQAVHFIRVVSPFIQPDDLIALDLEEGGETAAQIIIWLDAVEAVLRNRILIYGRKNLLDPIPMTTVQAARLKRYPTWIAGYPYFPDLYSEIPSWYVPNPNKWGRVAIWQYTDSGRVQGIEGDTDCNWLAPWFLAELGQPAPIPEPTPEPEPGEPMKGVVRTGFTLNIRNASNVVIGSIRAGDTVYGEVVNNRIYFSKVYRANGNVDVISGSSAISEGSTIWITITSGTEPEPTPTPAPALPAYFTAHDANGNELARYNKQ
jgi:GH25 family lysozyme M1 (1,4-beta-N-acetylmuramidase)